MDKSDSAQGDLGQRRTEIGARTDSDAPAKDVPNTDIRNTDVPGCDVPSGDVQKSRKNGLYSRRYLVLFLNALVPLFGLTLGWFMFGYELPYYSFGPGAPRNTVNVFQVEGQETYATEGEIYLTTVRSRRMTPAWAIRTWLDDSLHSEKAKDVRGSATEEQYIRANKRDLDESTAFATSVALSRLGHRVTTSGKGVFVEAVQDGGPASEKLKRGDVITAVNGQSVTTRNGLREVMKSAKPGDSVSLDLLDDANINQPARSVDVLAGEESGRPILGILVSTYDQSFSFPFKVNAGQLDIGGPSAGLAFSLGLLEDLTPGDLTGGNSIACTGTIDLGGNVGEIGDIEDKARSVLNLKPALFIVPESQADDARKITKDKVKVVGVKNLEDALRALGELGGNIESLPPAPETLLPEESGSLVSTPN